MNASLLLQISAGVVFVNSLLAALQILFSALAKQEPGWLTSVSKLLLSVAQVLGSNPPNQPPPAAPAA